MKKPQGYDEVQAFTGEFEQIKPGGHVCKILKVIAEDRDYGTLLRIGFDIVEGINKDFYKRKFDEDKKKSSDAKWKGMIYQTSRDDKPQFFKGFITAIENSNPGYKFDFNEQSLVGKLFGGVFGQEEYLNNNGEVKLITKCLQVRTVEKVREGIDAPQIKRLKQDETAFIIQDETELPF